jgi:C1A family cysteine protease
VNGSVVQTVNASSYNFSWDATPYAGTTPTLTATAKDAAGNSNSFTITVAVSTNVVVLPPPPGGSLPSSYSLTTPTPGNEGNEFACVPFAAAYAARSIEQYYRTNASSYNLGTNVFSPEYVYDQTKFSSDCGSGTSVGTVLAFMQQTGVCTWQTMPYSDVNGCSVVPTGAQNAEAANYKIGGYSKLVSTDQTAIKTLIVGKHPVIFNISCDDSFINAGPGFIWGSYSGSGGLPHCMSIVGYDDSKNAYKVINSWGTGWGDGGFGWIDYGWFANQAGYYCYAMNY